MSTLLNSTTLQLYSLVLSLTLSNLTTTMRAAMPSPTMPHPSLQSHHIRDTRFTPCASMPCAAQSPIMRHPKTERDSTLLPAQSQTTPSPPSQLSQHIPRLVATSTLLSRLVHHRRHLNDYSLVLSTIDASTSFSEPGHWRCCCQTRAMPRRTAVHCSKVPRQPSSCHNLRHSLPVSKRHNYNVR